MQKPEMLLSVVEVDKRMLDAVVLLGKINAEMPARYQDASKVMPDVYRLAAAAHARGGCTANQLRTLEDACERLRKVSQ